MHNANRLRAVLLWSAGLALVLSPAVARLGAQGQGGGQAVINAPSNPALRGFEWRAIGPVSQGARIDDLAVVESDTSTYFIGYAVSGLWKTTNNGTTYRNVFGEITHSIGDIAIAQSNPNIVYVGTGEPNNRQSSSVGIGMYKSTDGGETFAAIGLENTQSIGRVRVHPRDPNTVWVAAVGHLFGPNDDRGVFKSTDGGATWRKVLFINQDVGAIDLVVDPSDPDNLIAATYERRRAAWGFAGGGPGSGLHRSTDGGDTWTRLSGNGLPRGTMGRIGLDWSRSDPDVVFAQIEVAQDNEPPLPQDAPEPQAGRGGGGGRGGGNQPPDPTRSGIWRSDDKGRSWNFVSNENQRPMYYSQIRVDPNDVNVIYVGGTNPAKSTDGGATFTRLQGMGHVDNHAIWIDPNDSDHVMYGNDGGLDVSYDGGDSWESVRVNGLALPYHVSVGMDRPYTVCTGLQDNGSWCGPSTVRNQAIRAWHWVSVGGGDGFQTQIDPTNPNVFYTESQNGNIGRYDALAGTRTGIRPNAGGRGSAIVPAPPEGTDLNYNWNSPIRLSHHNPSTVLFGGNRLFISTNRGDAWRMTDELGKGIDVSQRTLLEYDYSLPNCGRGAGPGVDCIPSKGDGVQNDEWKTIIEIAESPLVPDLYWVGTADGNIQLSRDGGRTWTETSANLPGGSREMWVSGLEASWFDAGTAFASIDGHHVNDFTPYVFKTTNYGQSWTSISGDLPRGNVRSIRQDPVNANLLYAATEFGFYVTLNGGQSWNKFMPNLPNTRVDEVVVHPRENDLVLASHGYGIYIMDDITVLQQMGSGTPSAPTLFKPRDAVQWKTDYRLGARLPGMKGWAGENAPAGTAIAYYLPTAPTGQVMVTITNLSTGEAVRNCIGTALQGMNRFQWTFAGDGGGGGGGGRGGFGGQQQQEAPTGPSPCAGGGGGGRGGRGGGGGGGIGPATYQVEVTIGGQSIGRETFQVLEDIWMQ